MMAFLITILAAVFQRMTGPTYPIRGEVEFAGSLIQYKFLRSHETGKNYLLSLTVENPEVKGKLLYKRHPTSDCWSSIPLKRKGESLTASLPSQPPAGKLDYKVILSRNGKQITLPPKQPVVIRFKGSVPPFLLIPHIILMFLAILFSNRAGLEALHPQGNPRKLALWTTGFLFIGGFIFGPMVQYFAFGEFWSGFPLGHDLTDTKTLVALAAWILALIAGRGGKPARKWVLGASLILLATYIIPHSLLGSELDYAEVPKKAPFP